MGQDEVTVHNFRAHARHAQAERTKKQTREEKATSGGGSDKDLGVQNREMVLKHGG